MASFDASRAMLSREDLFRRFDVVDTAPLTEVLDAGRLQRQDPLLILQRNGAQLAFSAWQMAYHHIAQGELAGEPYLVAY